jgi:hypothetical protein
MSRSLVRGTRATQDREGSRRSEGSAASERIARPRLTKKLDGPLNRARITIKPVDPATLSKSRRRAILSRFGMDPDENF